MAVARCKKFNENEVLALVEGVKQNYESYLAPSQAELRLLGKTLSGEKLQGALTQQELMSYDSWRR